MVSAYLVALTLFAQTGVEATPVGRVVQLCGQVSVMHSHNGDEDEVIALKQAAFVHTADKIASQGGGWARLLFDDGSVIDVAPDSAFSIEIYRRQSASQVTIRLRVLNGRIWAHLSPRDDGEPDFAIVTAQAVANMRGPSSSVVVDVVEADTTNFTTVTGHASLYPAYLLGDALPAEVFGRQSVAVQGMQWPPSVVQMDADALRDMRAALALPPVLDAQSQAERVGRLEARRLGAGTQVTKAGLPLQVLPLEQPTVMPPPLNLDPGARNGRVNVTIKIND